VNEVGGQAVQQIPEDGVVGAVPDGGVELQVGGDPDVVIWFLKIPVPLQQSVKPHQVRELPGPGCLACRFFLEEDAHVVDLDDLLRIHLGYLQAPGNALKEPFLLEAGQRLPDGCPGDAETLGKRSFPNSGARLVHSGEDFAAQALEDAFSVNAGGCCIRHLAGP
jgi:hypothetical protein